MKKQRLSFENFRELDASLTLRGSVSKAPSCVRDRLSIALNQLNIVTNDLSYSHLTHIFAKTAALS